jgi:hypothetical protein
LTRDEDANRLASRLPSVILRTVSLREILHEIETLSPEQRWQVLERTREMLGSEIPESFKQAMEEIERGEVIELDDALQGLDRAE